MILFPVVVREMGLVARRAYMYRTRVGGAFVGLVAMAWILLLSSSQLPLGLQGSGLFRGLAGVVFYYCLAVGPTLVADSISAERRQGTLGLLFLTDLRGYDVVLGKWVAASMTAVFTVISLVPMSSVALLLGGVTLLDVGRMAIVWLSTLFASASVGILASSYTSDDRKAMFWSVIGVAIVGYGTYGPSVLLEYFGHTGWAESVEYFSAGFAYRATANWIPGGSRILPFGVSIAFLWGVGLASLWQASRHVERTAAGQPKSKWRVRWETLANQWAYGAASERNRQRGRLLDANPFLWLHSRHQRKKTYMWVFLLSMGGIWWWTTSFLSGASSEWIFNGFFFLFVGAMVKNWWASEVGERFVEDRQNGALELIFTTPVTPLEFARGQGMALRRVFGGPITGLLLFQVVWLGVMYFRMDSGQRGLSTFALVVLWGVMAVDLWALKWLGLWHGLAYPSSNRASVATLLRIGIGPWLLILAFNSVFIYWINYAAGGRMSFEETWVVAMLSYGLISLVFAVIFGVRARRRFLFSFRYVASEGLQASAIESALARAPVLPVRPAKVVVGLKPKIPAGEVSAEDVAPRRGWFRRHWLISGSVALVLFVFAAGVGHRWYWEHKMALMFEGLGMAGVPLTTEEFNGRGGVVEFDADTVRFRDSLRSFQKQDTLRVQLWQFMARKGNSEARKNIEKAVEANPMAEDWLNRVALLKRPSWRIDPSTFQLMGNRFDLDLMSLGKISAIRGILQLESGDRVAACETAIRLLQLCRYLGSGVVRFDETYLRDQCLSDTLELVQALLNSGTLPADVRSRMDALLREMGTAETLKGRLETMLVARVDLSRRPSRWMVSGGVFGGAVAPVPATYAFLNGASEALGIRTKHELKQIETIAALADAAKLPAPGLFQLTQSVEIPDYAAFSNWLTPVMWMRLDARTLVASELGFAGRCQCLRLALRADAYQATNGFWPNKLEQLITAAERPEFVGGMTGQPIQVEWEAKGNGVGFNAETPERGERTYRPGISRFQEQVAFVIARPGATNGPGKRP